MWARGNVVPAHMRHFVGTSIARRLRLEPATGGVNPAKTRERPFFAAAAEKLHAQTYPEDGNLGAQDAIFEYFARSEPLQSAMFPRKSLFLSSPKPGSPGVIL